AGTAAILGLIALLAGTVIVLRSASDPSRTTETVPVTRPAPKASRPPGPSTAPPATAPPATASPTTARPTPTTRPTPSTRPPTSAPPAGPAGVAVARLTACRRAPGGVRVGTDVSQTGGRPSAFQVTVEVFGAGDRPLGRATGRTTRLQPGASAPLKVLVPVSGSLSGATCGVVGTRPA
ncbi:MAG: hypothetical protein JWM05_838, partial [Acidimicrobiales bacterium]|nr:hypothetical protein [Acidimicrobiales bacterium]